MSGNIPVYEYSGSVKKLLHGLKFRSLRNAYRIFVPEMAAAVASMAVKPDLITPVPMSRRKLAKRGYNQSFLIAAALGRELGIPCVQLLKERPGFRSQRGLGRLERYINVIDRYKAHDINKFNGRTVLLVDDVFTTGSTINECSRQLLRCGAYAVYSITVARADPDKLTI
jgi:ComF family protein